MPYAAVATASRSTCTVSISWTSMAARLPLTAGPSGMPFTTNSASSSPRMVFFPRRTSLECPSAARSIARPGTRASSSCSSDCPGERRMSSAVSTVSGGRELAVGDPAVRCEHAVRTSSKGRNVCVTFGIEHPLREPAMPKYICEKRSPLMTSFGATLLAFLIPWSVATSQLRVASPNGRNVVMIDTHEGKLYYMVQRDGRPLLTPSMLGFEFRGAPPLRDGLRIVDSSRSTFDTTWTQPWGEVSRIRDHHNELKVSVAETGAPDRKFTVAFRAFNDGVAFRYEFPAQAGLGDFAITDELTEFAMADNARAWWIASNRPRLDRSEQLWSSGPVSTLDSVQTPLTMEFRNGKTFVVIHEANLVDYARMNIRGPRLDNRVLHADLAPYADGVKVRGHTPFVTPWRTIQIADKVTELSPSVIGLNLNPPPVLANTDWIKPMKYVGIWWGMHINTMTWSSGPKHGATTANTKRYIDFAAANGFGGVLVEGWNVGWDGDWIQNRNAFSFTQPYPDYDLVELARYAHSKGVKLIVHNETSGGIENYERQMDSAFALYQSLGLDAIKSGYVTDTITGGHSHWSQRMVQHYRHVIEKAAQYHIMLDVHEPIHDTGERRTYPNMMSREGARGQEYNAWGGEGGNPPEHETILFFTRLLDGPMDFTPGIFDILR